MEQKIKQSITFVPQEYLRIDFFKKENCDYFVSRYADNLLSMYSGSRESDTKVIIEIEFLAMINKYRSILFSTTELVEFNPDPKCYAPFVVDDGVVMYSDVYKKKCSSKK